MPDPFGYPVTSPITTTYATGAGVIANIPPRPNRLMMLISTQEGANITINFNGQPDPQLGLFVGSNAGPLYLHRNLAGSGIDQGFSATVAVAGQHVVVVEWIISP